MTHPVPVHTARGFGAAAVAPHELSTLAAIEIMAGGGNAVDGAIAANAVQGTVAPETCGIGGDLFALVHHPGMDSPACLSSSGRAGSGTDADALRKASHTTMPLYGAPPVTERSEGNSGGSSGRDRSRPKPLRPIGDFSRGPGPGPWPTPHP